MKPMRFLLAAAAVFAVILPATAADSNDPGYDNGPVWDFGSIKTADGHFDEYMKWVTKSWRAQQDGLKKAGLIVDYKVYLVQDPRQGDPDILLATEYKNLATFDMPIAQVNAIVAKISGPLAKQAQMQAARGSIRTVMSDMLTREVKFK